MDKYEIKKNGDDTWYLKNNIIHRDGDLPARESKNGNTWYKEGLIHRDNDLPAIMSLDGNSWYKEGLCHRDNDLPAQIVRDGEKQSWYKEGKRHRIGAPAFIQQKHSYFMYLEEWWENDEKHRIDGPAVTYGDGRKEWWLNGVQIPEEDFAHELSKRNLHEKLQEELLPLENKGKKVKI